MTINRFARGARRIFCLVAAMLLVVTMLSIPQERILPTAEAQATNPQPSGTCGGSVAFVVDLSNSLEKTDVDNLKNALTRLVGSLEGAPYNVGLYSFASGAPAVYAGPNLKATTLQTPGGVNAIKQAISALRPGNNHSQGGTNWEGGLRQVATDMQNGVVYDTVYFITDGAPTFDNDGANRNSSGNSGGDAGSTTEQKEIDRAVTQAQQITALGAKVIPVGTAMPSTVRVYDYHQERHWLWGWRDVWKSTNSPPVELLRKITSPGESPIQVNNYASLPDQLAVNFDTGCLHVVKEIVDGDGNVIQPGAGWDFNLTSSGGAQLPGSVRTDSTGSVEVEVQGLKDESVTIAEVPKADFNLVPATNGKTASCVAYQPGQANTPVPVENVGDTGIRLDLDSTKIIACTFRNTPLVPVKLTKQVVVNTPQLQEELGGRNYEFSYECRDPDGDVVATSGSRGVSLREGEIHDLGHQGLEPPLTAVKVPLGTQCDIQESTPDTEQGRLNVTTNWAATNADVISEDGLTTTVKVNADAYTSSSSTGATVNAVNTYTSEMATIKLRKRVTGEEVLAADHPISVEYSCRYVPNPDDTSGPGVGEDYPYFVDNARTTFPRNGTVDVGPFPVGTQCLFEETSPATNPITVEGYDLNVSWNSDICLDVDTARDSVDGLDVCQSNYVFIHPETGRDMDIPYTLEVTNNYSRQSGSLQINKIVDGPAVGIVDSRDYTFDVVCHDGDTGDVLFRSDTNGVRVAAGGSTTLSDIPVAALCDITERDPQIPNVAIDVLPSADNVEVLPAGQPTVVDMKNTFDYQTGSLSLEKNVDVDPAILDLFLTEGLALESYPVSAVCQVPGQIGTLDWDDEIMDGESVQVTLPEFGADLPLGTSCTFSESYELPEDLIARGVQHMASFSPQSVQLSDAGGTAVQLTNSFQSPRRDVVFSKSVQATGGLAGDSSLIPTEFNFTWQCGPSMSGAFTLSEADGWTHTFSPGVLLDRSCTVTEVANDPVELVRTTTVSGSQEVNQVGDTFIFSMPLAGNAVNISVLNSYSPVYGQVMVNKDAVLKSSDAGLATLVEYEVLGTGERTYPVEYVCTRETDNLEKSGVLLVKEGTPAELPVPVGATCELIERPVEIPATEGPEISYSTGDMEKATVTVLAPGEEVEVTITNQYELKTGSFHLKKKVDGEGVGTIPDDHSFELIYTCTFNDVVVASRTADDPYKIGRFDDARDFRVEGLPVGSECAVSEVPASAETEGAALGVRWTVTPSEDGWGAQEDKCELVSNCITSSTMGTPEDTATVTVTDRGAGSDDHFQGTLVVWNTYDYQKVSISLEKRLDDDGVELAANETFTFGLVCTLQRGSGIPDYIPVSNTRITQEVQITGEGVVTLEKPIPVFYDCVLNEQTVTGYDAEVATTFGGAVTESGGSVDPTRPEGASASFTTTVAMGTDHTVTVLNDYDRPRAVLELQEILADNRVNPYLNNVEDYDLNVVCEDPYTDNDLVRTLPVRSDGSIQEITGLPASAFCQVTADVSAKIPAGFEGVVNEHHRAEVTRGGVLQAPQGITRVTDIGLDKDDRTRVTFYNSYWVDQLHLGFTKVVEGDPEGIIYDPEEQFKFAYQCEVENLLHENLMPTISDDQVASFDPATNSGTVTGSFYVLQYENWSPSDMPTGSSCHVFEVVDDETQQLLDDHGLRLQPNYFYPDGDQVPPTDPDIDPIDETEVRYPVTESGVPLKEEKPFAVLVNSIYRTGGDVQVWKVNSDGSPLEGARFAIYGAVDGPDGPEMGEVVIEDVGFEPLRDEETGEILLDEDGQPLLDPTRFGAELTPRSYFLVETQAGNGAELLPRPWRFNVEVATPGTDSNPYLGNLEFKLGGYEIHSGLVEVEHSNPEDSTSPWIIKVANLQSGELPLTGDRGIWPGILAGVGLLLAAALWTLRRRS